MKHGRSNLGIGIGPCFDEDCASMSISSSRCTMKRGPLITRLMTYVPARLNQLRVIRHTHIAKSVVTSREYYVVANAEACTKYSVATFFKRCCLFPGPTAGGSPNKLRNMQGVEYTSVANFKEGLRSAAARAPNHDE